MIFMKNNNNLYFLIFFFLLLYLFIYLHRLLFIIIFYCIMSYANPSTFSPQTKENRSFAFKTKRITKMISKINKQLWDEGISQALLIRSISQQLNLNYQPEKPYQENLQLFKSWLLQSLNKDFDSTAVSLLQSLSNIYQTFKNQLKGLKSSQQNSKNYDHIGSSVKLEQNFPSIPQKKALKQVKLEQQSPQKSRNTFQNKLLKLRTKKRQILKMIKNKNQILKNTKSQHPIHYQTDKRKNKPAENELLEKNHKKSKKQR